MRTCVKVARGVLVVLAFALALPSSAPAQVLSEVVIGTVGGDPPCGGLRGRAATFAQPFYGPNLTLLCPPNQASVGNFGPGQLSAGTLAAETRLDLTDEQRRVYQRLKEKRDGSPAAASADGIMGIRGLGLFVSAEYEAFDKNVTRFESGYSSDKASGTVGVDYSFTRWATAGVAFTYSSVSGTYAQRGGDFDTTSVGGLLYATFFPIPGFFVDVVGGYARKNYTTDRAISFANTFNVGEILTSNGTASGETDGNEYRAGVNLGYDFNFGRVTFGPRLGVNYRYTTIDSFTEEGKRAVICNPTCRSTSGTGLELAYEGQDETSLTTVAGLLASVSFSTPFGVVVPQATFEYVHEFADNQRTIHFSFAEDFAHKTFRFQNDPPDRDYFNAGAGVVFVLPGGFSPFVNYRALLGYKDQSSHTVTVGLRFAF
jgi:outer membrane autotransporter protein